MALERLAALSGPRRLAVGLFLLLLVGFYLLAQVQLVAVVGSDGVYPGASTVLARYHGDPKRSRLHQVLDPTRSPEDARNMYQYLGPGEQERVPQRETLLRWVEREMPAAEWPAVRAIVDATERCAACHAPGARKADLPFDTYEHVVAGFGPDRGMSLQELSTSSHNHLMGFAVLGLLVSFVFTATAWRGPLVWILVAGVFVGGAADVASWWLTRAHGHPWEYLVMAGGGLFGGSLLAMVALSLDELWLRGRVGALLARPLAAARLARRDPA
jgi:hypothetical protein